jgi:hypothetical protein
MKSLGLILIDTENHDMASYVLSRSIDLLDPKDVIVFSDWPLISGAQYVKIDKIKDITDYNKILIRGVANFLKCDHYLVVQYDGFPLDRRRFLTNFLSYDYIGAIWPNEAGGAVGNGGFSLRSKKLFEVLADLSVFYDGTEPEDLYICETLRRTLESKWNIDFAPVKIAQKFSFEQPFQDRSTFGFHGVFNLPWVFQSDFNFLLSHLSDKTLQTKRAWLEFGAHFLSQDERKSFLSLLYSRLNV